MPYSSENRFLKYELEEIKKQLDFDTEELANRKLGDLQQHEKSLQGQIEEHKEALNTALQKFSSMPSRYSTVTCLRLSDRCLFVSI